MLFEYFAKIWDQPDRWVTEEELFTLPVRSLIRVRVVLPTNEGAD